jgi:hypothetical protein
MTIITLPWMYDKLPNPRISPLKTISYGLWALLKPLTPLIPLDARPRVPVVRNQFIPLTPTLFLIARRVDM